MKKIMLLGDSIRKGYDTYVKMALEGQAEVVFPADNCRFTTYMIRNIHEWKGQLGCDNGVDLVHFNVGLWDCLHMPDGEALVPIDQYRVNLERIVRMLRTNFPNAKIIFATSTPVIERLFGICKRYNNEIEEYNAVAKEIMAANGIAVNDLYALLIDKPESYHSDLTHFYTKVATKEITEQVLSYIDAAIGTTAKKLDYDALFGETANAIGI